MSTKVEPQSRMTSTQRGHGVSGGGVTRIPVAVRSMVPALPPVVPSSSSSSTPPPSNKPSPPVPQSPPSSSSRNSAKSERSVLPSIRPSSSSSRASTPNIFLTALSEEPSSSSQQRPPSSSSEQPSSSSQQQRPSSSSQQPSSSPSQQPSSQQQPFSSQASSSSPQSTVVVAPTQSSSSPSSSQLAPVPLPVQTVAILASPPESGREAAPPPPPPAAAKREAQRPRKARPKEVGGGGGAGGGSGGALAVWKPEALLPSTRAGPPPEDRLSGANTARAGGASLSLSTARSETGAAKSSGMQLSMTVRGSLQYRTYREGLQFMRERIADVGTDLDQVLCRYHHADAVDDDLFVDYLKACDAHFLRANTALRKRSVTLQVIDSETRLVSLLNQLREEDDGRCCDPETVQYLTEYWENVKDTVEGLKGVVSKFQTNVLNRLKKNYISDYYAGSDSSAAGAGAGAGSGGDNNNNTPLEVCSSFTADISTHMTELEGSLSNTRILLKSFHSGVHQNLFDKSDFADLVVVSCDLKAFPLLRLVADVAGKVRGMCEVARQWLSRDERFIQEVHSNIRQARQRSKRREEDLKSEKEKQKKYEKSVKAAHILLHNNRDKLSRIETELRVLEDQVNESERDKQHRYDQLQQKETMVTFLQITQAQTKRNYSLQATRVKLARQAKDLKELLGAMERDLDAIQTEIHVKAEEKVRLSEKVEHHLKSYDALRCDMERFSSRMEQLESEVTDLSGQLLHLEMIHNLKTSPEKVEEIYDRPSTVKLAPSLKEKIKERSKRRVKPK